MTMGLTVTTISSLFVFFTLSNVQCRLRHVEIVMNSLCNKQKHCDNESWKRNCPGSCSEDNSTTGIGNGGINNNIIIDVSTNKTSENKKCDKRSPCISMAQANSEFKQRCIKAGLSPRCADHCRYNEHVNTLKAAFTSDHACALNDLHTYLRAAANGRNNIPCCQDTGVLSQKKTGICGPFCDPNGPVWPGKGEGGKYIPCVGILEGIMKCHYYAEGAD